jgi:acetamidase/formamidase
MTIHRLGRDQIHGEWDPALPPRLTIASGETAVIETRDAANGKVRDRMTAAELEALPGDLRVLVDQGAADQAREFETPGHALTGPIAIEDAQPGDTLQIDVLAIEPAAWGWSSVRPGFGLLADDFPDRFTRVWDLRDGVTGRLGDRLQAPLAPFLGVMGVAPAGPRPVSTIPPRSVGGNLDIKQLTAGSTLYLPVAVPGALFSTGDAHGAQGDGEVCGTGIEMESVATLRFTLRRDLVLDGPRFEIVGALPESGQSGWFATTGIGPDLYAASQAAIRAMIAHLGDRYGLPAEDAYILCSVAVDLRISEVVDAPNWVVSAFLPTSVIVS